MAEIEDLGALYTSQDGTEISDVIERFIHKLMEQSRPGDVVGHTARLEFGVILPETSRNEANSLAQTISRKAERSFVSVGLASYPRDTSDAEGLIEKARQAMSAAKSEGGDTVMLPV